MSEGGSQIPASRRADVQKDIDKLKARVAHVTITTNVAGAEVFVDDVSVGHTPLDKNLLVSAGRRKISATKEGYAPASRVIEIASGDTAQVPLNLEELAPGAPQPVASATAEPTPEPPPPEPSTTQPAPIEPAKADTASGGSFPWPAWLITAGLAGGTTACGILALGASSDLKDLKSHASPSRDELDSASSKSKNLALVTDILLGATVIAGGVSVYLTVSGGSSKTEATDAKRPAPEVKVGVTPGGLSVFGAF
jgi:hypothetical protein